MQSTDKIHSCETIAAVVEKWKAEKKKIAFTNGCFDLLHLGHVDYLEKARQKGDVLIVGLNSDASVQRIKGPERPIMTEISRSRLLASMFFVDAVVLFDEDTPLELIRAIMPDVLIKGQDYQISNIVGADIVMKNGGKVETIELVYGYSTSNVITHIKKL
jgi:rfaE bifunctional protein nucleotidyltransferase chain/domain